MDAGRFERFEEARRQPDGDDIVHPHRLPATGGEAQRARIGERLPIEIGEQRRRRFIIRNTGARVDIAIAGAVLQRNAPLPAGRPCRRPRIGGEIASRGTGDSHGAIARQPLRPILITGAERLFDQQSAKPRAIDEQLPGHRCAAFKRQGSDVAACRVAADAGDPAFDTHHAARFGIAPQIDSIEAGVEMIGVNQRLQRRRRIVAAHETPGIGGGFVVAIGAKRRIKAERPAAQPVMVKADQPQVTPRRAKGVHVAVPGTQPAIEFDAELDAALRFAQEIILVDAQPGVEQPDLRDGRLADTDGADVIRFDQRHPPVAGARFEEARQRCRRHPAGGAAADDDDIADGATGHGRTLPVSAADAERALVMLAMIMRGPAGKNLRADTARRRGNMYGGPFRTCRSRPADSGDHSADSR